MYKKIVFLSLIFLCIIFLIYIIMKDINAIKYAGENDIYCSENNCRLKLLNIMPQNSNMVSANLINIVESNATIKIDGLTQLMTIGNIKGKHPSGRVWKDVDGDMYISFRGSQYPSDWVVDLDYKQTDLEDGVKIHSGFYNDAVSLYKELPKLSSVINISGHSLGSSIALIIACMIGYANPTSTINLHVFACPRTGNKEFYDSIPTNVNIVSFVNTADAIPTLPPSVAPNFETYTEPYFYSNLVPSDTCVINTFSDNWKSLINNHLMGVYTQNASKF